MLLRDSYTEANRVSSGSSTNYIDLGVYYDKLVVTSTLTGVVTAYMPDHSTYQVPSAINDAGVDDLKGVELPAGTVAGTYSFIVKAVKCATGADAAKLIVAR